MAMHEGPFMSSSEKPEDDEDDDENGKPRKNRRFNLASVLNQGKETGSGKSRSSSSLFELGNLTLGKDKVAETGDKTEKSPADKQPEAKDVASSLPSPEQEAYHLGDNQIGGGEFIIDLHKPVQEVIQLRTEQALDDAAARERTEQSLRQQLEQQMQGRFETPEPTEPEPPSGGREIPPTASPEEPTAAADFEQTPQTIPELEEPPASAETAPEPVLEPSWAETPQDEPEPAQIYREYMARQAAAQQATEPAATKEYVRDAIHDESRRWRRRGWKRGFKFGAAYEHLLHGRREARAERRARMQREHLEASRKTLDFGVREQARQQAEMSSRLGMAERSFENAEQKYTDQTLQLQETMRQTQEQLKVPPEHRLEMSAWLMTQVDRRTGKAVESPVFRYGHEYYRERAQETAPLRQRNAAAGGLALIGGTQSTTQPTAADGASVSPLNIPSATMQGAPPPLQRNQPDDHTRSSASTTAPLWPWLLALLVVVIGLIIALS